ncbi:hypothetical protein MKX03_021430 [Papaver bracteatum]|nr:hypothetical protein MKX03_021430 [Papaver bracteatum]
MAHVIAFAEEFEKNADKKINRWAVFGSKMLLVSNAYGKAAAVYLKLAGCHLKLDIKQEAASAYADAANSYKERSMLIKTPYHASIKQCAQKVAQSAQLEQYPGAIEIYEDYLEKQSLDNKFLNYSVKGCLLNAGLSHLYEVDVFTISNALERYEEMDPTFSRTHVQRVTDVFREGHSMIRQDPWKTRLLLRVKKKS